jgi:GNAT superfamily N-acetyltransferase
VIQDRIYLVKAAQSDSEEIARILRTCFDAMTYLPVLHTPEEDVSFIRNIVFSKCKVWVAKDEKKIVGFCAFRSGWVDHLYILPEYHRRGIGTALLAKAIAANQELTLWTFQKNSQARVFYESHGFIVAEMTDGQGNEEKEPDVRYIWQDKTRIESFR